MITHSEGLRPPQEPTRPNPAVLTINNPGDTTHGGQPMDGTTSDGSMNTAQLLANETPLPWRRVLISPTPSVHPLHPQIEDPTTTKKLPYSPLWDRVRGLWVTASNGEEQSGFSFSTALLFLFFGGNAVLHCCCCLIRMHGRHLGLGMPMPTFV